MRKYSDRLLELRAKALMPEYREHAKLDVKATRGEDGELGDVLRDLTTDELRQFEALLTRAEERRAERQ